MISAETDMTLATLIEIILLYPSKIILIHHSFDKLELQLLIIRGLILIFHIRSV